LTNLSGGLVLDRFRTPRRRGALDGPHAVAEDVNPLCGDRLRLEVRLGPEGRLIEAVRYQGDACAIALAAADVLAEAVEGGSPAAARELSRERLVLALEATIRPSRLACVKLPLDILKKALAGLGETPDAGSRG
jgi:nitrogen fixation NifU-like protein